MRITLLMTAVILGGTALIDKAHPTGNHVENEAGTTIINPPELYNPVSNGYSHVVMTQGGGKTAYISGQGGERVDGSLPPEFDAQVRQAYRNLGIALEAVGARPQQVVKLTTYVVEHDHSKLEVMTAVVKNVFGEALPAQTLVPVPRLALDGMLFEVDAVVALEGPEHPTEREAPIQKLCCWLQSPPY